MRLDIRIFIVFVMAAAMWQNCTRPTLVGSELLDDDIADIGFTDTLDIRFTAATEDSVLMYSLVGTLSNGPQFSGALCGNLDDPFFGTSRSDVYSEIFLNGIATAILNNTIDSVILTLAYDTVAFYGDVDEPVSMEVWKLTEELDIETDYYSNQTFPVGTAPIGSVNDFVARPQDSLSIIRPNDTTLLKPHMRIPLNPQFISEMLAQDTSTFQLQDTFDNWWPGFMLTMNEGDNTMLSFNLSDAQSGVTVYYSQDTLAGEYTFTFRGPQQFNVRSLHFEHDYTGAHAESFIGNTEAGDSLVFVQSMSGLNAIMEIPGITNLDDVLINQAELELYAADVPGNDTTLYSIIPQLSARVLNDEGELILARDVAQAISIQQLSVFGGTPEYVERNGTPQVRYVLSLTSTVQDIIAGKTPNRIFISSFLKQSQPERGIFYGPGHAEFPARLRITFTRTR